MSVAFRRESDEEHLEPKFELPMPAGVNLVTARGRALMAAKVAELEAVIAAESDDAARDVLKRELRYWHTRLTTAEIAPPPPAEAVAFGSRVRFRLNGAEKVIDLVGHDEADPAAGRIAFQAPLARALMKAEEGDLLDFGGKPGAIEVLETGPIPDGDPR
jgi:transcription elongation GreA/GreB family factor